MNDTIKKVTIQISDEEKKVLDRLKSEGYETSQSKIISRLLREYKSVKPTDSLSLEMFDLSLEDKTEVEEALLNSKSEFSIVAKEGLLQRSRYLNTVSEKQALLDEMSEKDMQNATFKGAAAYRIEKAINTVKSHNDAQPEKQNKVCLTKGIIFKLTGSNRQAINKYFDQYEVMIADHNGKHQLTDSDNRKGKGFSFKELLGL